MKKKILITGGTGLIGTALKEKAISQDWEVTLLSRQPGPGRITWNPEKGTIDLPYKMHFDAIINLAGTSLSQGRWNEKRKKEIYDSRIKSCRTLESYLYDGRLSTDFYLGASGIGIYGDNGVKEINEKTTYSAKDWFVKTVVDWEKEHHRVAALDIRTVIIRIGIVLSHEGGALQEILKKSRFGVLPYFGNGRQIWPWIHIDDLTSLIFYCIGNSNLEGIFLGVSPDPVTNKKLIQTINAHSASKKIVLGVPRFVLAIVLGEMHRVLFDSCNAIPQKALHSGFQFAFPTIAEAAKDLNTNP